MIDRRRLLFTAAAGAGLAATGQVFAQTSAPAAGSASATLAALMDRIVQESLMTSPEILTSLGLDKGPAAPMKAMLDDRSQAKIDADKVVFRKSIADLKAIDRSALTGDDGVYYDTLEFFGDTAISGYAFPYGGGGPYGATCYTVSQLTGSYQSLPDFLDTQHSIETAQDAEAYLSRVSAFATALDQETARMERDFAAGAIPPDFIIDKALLQMANLTGTPAAEMVLTASVARRTAEKNIPGDWASRAEAIVSGEVYPALQRQADALKARRAEATHEAGCWRLPDGDAFYEYGIKSYTTTTLSGDEIHRIGLDQLAELSARADVLLKAQGLTQGSVGDRIAALGKMPEHLYDNTDEAKEQLLRDLNDQMADMARRLPQYFGRIPTSTVEIRRVPKFIEAGAPGGYYNAPTLDGSRPGAYYINLRDTAEWPRFQLPTLTYHEASPGHHHQIALQQEKPGTPLLMKVLGFSAYSEGWALYSEQLADEMGVYEGNPVGQIGYLQSLMFRATRLVVDSGMHAKRWSRERAIDFMRDALGDAESAVTTEIERYCVWPGQACSYKLGHNKWVELREASKAALGDRFDIRAFHDIGLGTGGVPLTVLDKVMTEWTASQKA
ncbi:DUF885 domain-containing protein [Brevundimonas variabilis]|uniref:Uncharacterized protein (DUF885 family) n=1 Tax=Brevundimonas variabilis TaxID=74312 RepID=A0A7W9CG33_9CAUL|nr:DUF885 family protein [Brevundimonas variabilis]MBB5744975.1 uncharacterized protein (DUF885 family) [Brevundimonas variabilis]